MCIFHTASWSSALTHHNISQSWFILPKLVQNVLKVGSFSKSWFKMCPKLVHFLKVGSFSKSWYEMCQNQVNKYISLLTIEPLRQCNVFLHLGMTGPPILNTVRLPAVSACLLVCECGVWMEMNLIEIMFIQQLNSDLKEHNYKNKTSSWMT